MSPTLTSLSAATRHAGTIALILLATAVTSSQAQEPQMPNPPTAVKGMKPYEVVDKVLSHKHDLLLTNNQTQNLTRLRDQLKKGEPITEPTGRGRHTGSVVHRQNGARTAWSLRPAPRPGPP